jgi:hypothetical protein
MTNMRDEIADIIGKQTFMDSPSFVADAILEALPDMIAPLVWFEKDGHFYSNGYGYSLILFGDGYLVDYDDLSLGHGYTLEQAQTAADTHYRVAIMAAFTGATSK